VYRQRIVFGNGAKLSAFQDVITRLLLIEGTDYAARGGSNGDPANQGRIVSTESEGEETYFRHASNIGSVGKPKAGDLRACYVLLTIEETARPGAREGVTMEFLRSSTTSSGLPRASSKVSCRPVRPDAARGTIISTRPHLTGAALKKGSLSTKLFRLAAGR
jgi:hypothetical protein